jgi:hypothetical protein
MHRPCDASALRALRLVLLLAACACYTSTPALVGNEPLREGLQRPTRTAAECGPAIDSARAQQIAVQPPQPRLLFIPPPRRDRFVRSFTVVMRVDVDGRTSRDSTQITGLEQDAAYARQIRSLAGRLRFYPAVANGCAVPASAKVEMTVGP